MIPAKGIAKKSARPNIPRVIAAPSPSDEHNTVDVPVKREEVEIEKIPSSPNTSSTNNNRIPQPSSSINASQTNSATTSRASKSTTSTTKKGSTSRKTQNKDKGKAKEASTIEPKRKSTPISAGSKPTAIAIGIGVPSTSAATSNEEESPASKRRRLMMEAAKKKKESDFRLPENMRTLDDTSEDPAKPDLLDKSMSYFTKDIDGVVSKTFKEMEMKRYEELKKAEEAKKMSSEELEAFKKKEEEEAANKKKIEEAKKAEEEKRRKEKANSVLQET